MAVVVPKGLATVATGDGVKVEDRCNFLYVGVLRKVKKR